MKKANEREFEKYCRNCVEDGDCDYISTDESFSCYKKINDQSNEWEIIRRGIAQDLWLSDFFEINKKWLINNMKRAVVLLEKEGK